MEVNLKDVLHLHLGCDCIVDKSNLGLPIENNCRLLGIDVDGDCDVWFKDTGKNSVVHWSYIKPILRPLSSMTEEEAKELYLISPYSKGRSTIKSVKIKENIVGYQPNIIEIYWAGVEGNHQSSYASGRDILYLNQLDANQFAYLLKEGFDLFNLIKNKKAIDKTTLKQNNE